MVLKFSKVAPPPRTLSKFFTRYARKCPTSISPKPGKYVYMILDKLICSPDIETLF